MTTESTVARPAPADPPRPAPADPPGSAPYVDLLVDGAGPSGTEAAGHLHTEARGTSYAILEARGASGGTWDLFRFPEIRSDSDMFTIGYSFRPWRGAVWRGTSGLVMAKQTLGATTHGRRIVPSPRFQVVPHCYAKGMFPPAVRGPVHGLLPLTEPRLTPTA